MKPWQLRLQSLLVMICNCSTKVAAIVSKHRITDTRATLELTHSAAMQLLDRLAKGDGKGNCALLFGEAHSVSS